MGKWEVTRAWDLFGVTWLYNVDKQVQGKVFPSIEKPGFLCTLVYGLRSTYFPDTQLAEAKAWVEAMYALGVT